MYWTLFLTFVKIGMFTIGGGYAMLPLIQRDVVDRGWMTKEDFIDVFTGWRCRRSGCCRNSRPDRKQG